MKKTIYLFLIFPLFLLFSFQPNNNTTNPPKDILEKEKQWVDSVFQSLSLDQRIGQLMWIRAHSNLGEKHIAAVTKLITEYEIGGLTFFQGTPEKQAELTNRYQELSNIPLVISVDAEWGLGMRFKEHGFSFPKQIMLGAIQDNRLIYEMGKEVALQCRRIGMHVNFAPVVDVNNNPLNPVINYRSFGEDRYNVAAKSYMYMKGMQDYGVLASAKHFPGHGDTDTDSHLDLPIINHSMNRLDSIEMFPFKILIDQGVGSIMIAHLSVPAIDATPNFPTSLSRKAVTDLLKNDLNYQGLILTDGLGMKGVTKHHGNGEVEAKSLAAGNDVLLLPQDIPASFKAIKAYMADGRLDSLQVFESVKRTLRLKYQMGLNNYQPIKLENLRADLNNNHAKALKRKMIENALTLVRNDDNLIPFREMESLNLASLAIGASAETPFQEALSFYKDLEKLQTGKEISIAKSKKLIHSLKDKDAVIVSLHDMSSRASQNFGISKSTRNFIKDLQDETEVILVLFGNPYALKYFDDLDCVLQAYEEDEMVQDLASQALFGVFPIQGRLPITASAKSKFGQGLRTQSLFRLGRGMPEEVGLRSDSLALIDTLAQMVMDSNAAPGCVVLVAKDGKIVYHKAFGHHTYDKKQVMSKTDIFDLASVTKVCASTLSTMKLHEEGHISIFDPMSKHLPSLDSTNKSDIIIRDMLSHHAKLAPWIPFYKNTVSTKGYPKSEFYQKKKRSDFEIEVANNLFMNKAYVDSIWLQIDTSALRENVEYKYSDLGLLLTGRMIQEVSKQPLEDYVATTFYQPLGLQTTGYRPLERFTKTQIPPTEEDNYFRHQRLQGHVHDMGAAMLNGVAGHAGLFSNASDLAVIMQMLLNKGYYGGTQFLKAETINLFTQRCDNCSRRGIGFDMLQTDITIGPNMAPSASNRTFGHYGFTGTCVWADPEHQTIVVFLSNRTYPKMSNNNLGDMDFRTRVQEVVYRALDY